MCAVGRLMNVDDAIDVNARADVALDVDALVCGASGDATDCTRSRSTLCLQTEFTLASNNNNCVRRLYLRQNESRSVTKQRQESAHATQANVCKKKNQRKRKHKHTYAALRGPTVRVGIRARGSAAPRTAAAASSTSTSHCARTNSNFQTRQRCTNQPDTTTAALTSTDAQRHAPSTENQTTQHHNRPKR